MFTPLDKIDTPAAWYTLIEYPRSRSGQSRRTLTR